MQIDAATRRNLELLTSLSGERRGSLLGAIDRTVTGAGRPAAGGASGRPAGAARARSAARLDAVQALVDQPAVARGPAERRSRAARTWSARSRGSRSAAADRATSLRPAARSGARRGASRRRWRRAARRLRRAPRASPRSSDLRDRPGGGARRRSAAARPRRRLHPRRAGTPSSTSSAACAIRHAATIAALEARYAGRDRHQLAARSATTTCSATTSR